MLRDILGLVLQMIMTLTMVSIWIWVLWDSMGKLKRHEAWFVRKLGWERYHKVVVPHILLMVMMFFIAVISLFVWVITFLQFDPVKYLDNFFMNTMYDYAQIVVGIAAFDEIWHSRDKGRFKRFLAKQGNKIKWKMKLPQIHIPQPKVGNA